MIINEMSLDDREKLDTFLASFEDFFLQMEGRPLSAQELLTGCPEGKDPQTDKSVLGLYTAPPACAHSTCRHTLSFSQFSLPVPSSFSENTKDTPPSLVDPGHTKGQLSPQNEDISPTAVSSDLRRTSPFLDQKASSPPPPETRSSYPSLKKTPEKKTLVGVCDLIHHYPCEATHTLGYFLIHPAWRHQSWGSFFLQALSARLRPGTLRCVVQVHNPLALSFWRRHGFQQAPSPPPSQAYLSPDVLILEKPLF